MVGGGGKDKRVPLLGGREGSPRLRNAIPLFVKFPFLGRGKILVRGLRGLKLLSIGGAQDSKEGKVRFLGSSYRNRMGLLRSAEERGAAANLRFRFPTKWYANSTNTTAKRLDDALQD